MLRRSFLVSVILGLLLVADSGAREWTDSTGAFTVEATLVGVSGDSVWLQMQNGIMVQVPIERLCRADRVYVQSVRQAANPPINETLVAIDKALEKKISLDFVDTPLDVVVSHTSKLTDIDIEMDVRAMDDVGIGTDQPVTLQRENVSLADALGEVLKPLKLTWAVRDDVLMITTPEEVVSELETRVYVPSRRQNSDSLIADITKNIQPRSWGHWATACKISSSAFVISHTYHGHREIEKHYRERLRAIRPSHMAVPSSVLPKAVASALNVPVSLACIEAPLGDVVQFLGKTAGVKISLDKAALSDVGIGLDAPMTRKLNRVRLRCVLNLLLRDLELTWYPKDEGMVITTPERAETHLYSARYDAKGLTKNPFVGDDLISAIKKAVAPQTWDDVGGPASIKRGDGNTIEVQTTWMVHAEIEQLMQDLRQAQTMQNLRPQPRR